MTLYLCKHIFGVNMSIDMDAHTLRCILIYNSKRILFCANFCNNTNMYACIVLNTSLIFMRFESNRLSIAALLVLTSFNGRKFRFFSNSLNKLRQSLLLVSSSWFSTFIYFHPYTEYKYRYFIFTIRLRHGWNESYCNVCYESVKRN